MRLHPGEFLGRQIRVHASSGFTITHYQYTANSDLPLHEHAYLSFPLSGSYEERCGRATTICAASRALFHPPGEMHRDHIDRAGAQILSVEFDARWLARLRDDGVHTEDRLELDTPIFERAKKLARLLVSQQSALRLEAAAIDLLAELPTPASEAKSPRWMRHVLDCLDASTARPSLASLAEIAGVHQAHLARTFRKTHGCTVGEYIRRARVERAASLLGNSRRRLVEIAAECGFSDQSHLCREFKRATGLTPAAFRARR